MRRFWTLLLSIAFVMSGTLVSAAHTQAHIQPVAENAVAAQHHSDQSDGHHDESLDHAETSDHHKHSGDTNDHGHELHVTALDVAALPAMPAVQPLRLNPIYLDRKYPAPVLPSDPFPDRA